MINTIRAKIKSIIQGLDKIQEVNDYEKVGFDGYPAVNIIFTGNDSNFWSVATNQRGYNFTIRVFMQLNGNPQLGQYNDSKQLAEKVMSDCVDQILDAFDRSSQLDKLVDILRAAPSQWNYNQTSEGWTLMADINLQAVKFVSNR